jgi:hypothetical protein
MKLQFCLGFLLEATVIITRTLLLCSITTRFDCPVEHSDNAVDRKDEYHFKYIERSESIANDTLPSSELQDCIFVYFLIIPYLVVANFPDRLAVT